MAARIVFAVVALFFGCLGNPTSSSAAEAVAWRTNLDAAKIEAAQSNRLVLLHFYTKSCGPCRKLDKNVFSQPQIAQSIEKDYVPVKVDAEASPALRGAFRIQRVPTEVIITPQGTQVASMGSPSEANDYVSRLGQVANHFRQTNQQLMRASHQAPEQVNNAYANLNVTRQATSQPQATAPPQAVAKITENPYVTRPTPPTASQQPVAASVGSRYVDQPSQASQAGTESSIAPQSTAQSTTVAAQQPRTQMPPNAMPQSYKQNPYADNTTPVAHTPTTQQLAQLAPSAPQQATTTSTDASSVAPAQATANVTATPKQPMAPIVDKRVTPTADNTITPTPPSTPSGIVASKTTATAPLGFDGYCPVTLKLQNKWVKGKVEHGIVHRDRLYLFVSEEARQQFYTHADKFSPVFSGCDPVLMLEQQQEIPGSRQFGYRHKGSFYLFANKLTMQKFAQNPDSYSEQIRQAMTKIDSLQNGGIIRR